MLEDHGSEGASAVPASSAIESELNPGESAADSKSAGAAAGDGSAGGRAPSASGVRQQLLEYQRALRELQTKSDDSLIVGKLHHQIIALKQALSARDLQYKTEVSELAASRATIFRLEKELESRNTDLFRIQNHFRARLSACEKQIVSLQLETHVAGVVPVTVLRGVEDKQKVCFHALLIWCPLHVGLIFLLIVGCTASTDQWNDNERG